MANPRFCTTETGETQGRCRNPLCNRTGIYADKDGPRIGLCACCENALQFAPEARCVSCTRKPAILCEDCR